MKSLTRRSFLLKGMATSVCWASSSFLSLGSARARNVARPPNVLFIMSDQHNARALSCYGSREVKTPNLDRLARDGALFEKAFCQTGQCVPSRYSIWTGKYARSHGTYSNGMAQNVNEDTVADLFGKAGYVSGTVGKHHMEMNEKTGNHGFNAVFDRERSRFSTDGEFLPYDEVHPGRANVGKSAVPNEEHPTGIITSEAIKFIRANREKPFVLWYSFYGPHTPICPSSPWADQYDPEKLTLPPNNKYALDHSIPDIEELLSKSGRYSKEEFHRKTLAYYYGLVSQIDYNIGTVLDELDRLGLSENTLVVYTADHGEMMGEHGAWTKGRTGYDATLRVPLLIRFPGQVQKGSRFKELVCSIDLLPTLLAYCGLDIPKSVQGINLKPLISSGSGKTHTYVFSELGSSTDNTCIAVRSERYKYVLYRSRGQAQYEQLFDLNKDEWEMENQIRNPEYSEASAEMRKALADWEAETPAAPPVGMLQQQRAQRKKEE